MFHTIFIIFHCIIHKTVGALATRVYEYQISYESKLSKGDDNSLVKIYMEKDDEQKGGRTKRASSTDTNGKFEIEFPYCQNTGCRGVNIKVLVTVKPGFRIQHYPIAIVAEKRLLKVGLGSVRTFQQPAVSNVCGGKTSGSIVISDWVCRGGGHTCKGKTQQDGYGIYTASSSQTVRFNGNVFVRVAPADRRSLR